MLSIRHQACPRQRIQSGGRRGALGVSLIEVLVSIVISSIGLLALAGVNAASIRYSKMSQYRGTATLLASDIGERMRANKAGFVAGNYEYVTSFATQATAATLPTGALLCDDPSAVTHCTIAQIADLDLRQWRMRVRNQLPEGSVSIRRDATPVGADVYVVWRDPAVASNDEAPAANNECPNSLTLAGDKSVRCIFFRVQL